jgi:hypothetical protein
VFLLNGTVGSLVVAPAAVPGYWGLCVLSLGRPLVELVREGDVGARDYEAGVEYGAGGVVVAQDRGVRLDGLWQGRGAGQGGQRRGYEDGC